MRLSLSNESKRQRSQTEWKTTFGFWQILKIVSGPSLFIFRIMMIDGFFYLIIIVNRYYTEPDRSGLVGIENHFLKDTRRDAQNKTRQTLKSDADFVWAWT